MDYKISWVRTELLKVVCFASLYSGKMKENILHCVDIDVLLTLLSFPLLVCTR